MLREDIQAVMDVIRGRSNSEVHLEESEGLRLHLQYADLRGATLHGADLRRAILWGADLSGAFPSSTRLDCALLNDSKLFDTQFSNEGDDPATGLTQQQLDEASGDPEANWRSRFRNHATIRLARRRSRGLVDQRRCSNPLRSSAQARLNSRAEGF